MLFAEIRHGIGGGVGSCSCSFGYSFGSAAVYIVEQQSGMVSVRQQRRIGVTFVTFVCYLLGKQQPCVLMH